MTKEDKIRVVRYLNDAGAFLITKSGDRIASVLGHLKIHALQIYGERHAVRQCGSAGEDAGKLKSAVSRDSFLV